MRVLLPADGNPPYGWGVGQRVALEEGEAHHLKVRRARDRQQVDLLDGAGLNGTGVLVQTGSEWQVELITVEKQPPPPSLTLAVAAGDRERFSWMVEKAVELGVTQIIPLETARTAGVASRLKASHIERLRRVVLESIKQCGASWAPSVGEPMPWAKFLRHSLAGTSWLADSWGEPLPAVLREDAIAVVIGPEGGLSDQERTAAVDAGYRPMVLGFHTLRFETAALAAAAAVAQARMRGRHG